MQRIAHFLISSWIPRIAFAITVLSLILIVCTGIITDKILDGLSHWGSDQAKIIGQQKWIRQLSDVPPIAPPQWSSDSNSIVFASISEYNSDTHIVDAEGDDLLTIAENGYWPSISSDGARVLYSTTIEKQTLPFVIASTRLDGTETQFITTSRFSDVYPVWSPSGESIAFSRFRGGMPESAGIYIRELGSSNSQLLSPFDSDKEYMSGPVWAPNGKYIAYALWERGSGGAVVYVVTVEGAERRKVFATSEFTVSTEYYSRVNRVIYSVPSLSWAPNGTSLSFVLEDLAREDGEQGGVYVVRPDGTGSIRILAKHAGDQIAWSPDGEEILSSRGFAVSIDGMGFREIFPPGLTGWVAWSPDSSRIAVSTEDGRLITLNRDGTGLHKLAYLDHNGRIILADSPEEMKSLDLSICIREATILKPVVPEPYANPGLVNDCEALLRSGITLDGIANLDWNEKQPISQWEGVIVRGDLPRVERLVLSTKNLTGAIPKELGELTALEELDLSHNKLSGEIPPEMAGLRNLTYLSIQGNSLSGCVPIELSELWVKHSGLERCGIVEEVSP